MARAKKPKPEPIAILLPSEHGDRDMLQISQWRYAVNKGLITEASIVTLLRVNGDVEDVPAADIPELKAYFDFGKPSPPMIAGALSPSDTPPSPQVQSDSPQVSHASHVKPSLIGSGFLRRLRGLATVRLPRQRFVMDLAGPEPVVSPSAEPNGAAAADAPVAESRAAASTSKGVAETPAAAIETSPPETQSTDPVTQETDPAARVRRRLDDLLARCPTSDQATADLAEPPLADQLEAASASTEPADDRAPSDIDGDAPADGVVTSDEATERVLRRLRDLLEQLPPKGRGAGQDPESLPSTTQPRTVLRPSRVEVAPITDFVADPVVVVAPTSQPPPAFAPFCDVVVAEAPTLTVGAARPGMERPAVTNFSSEPSAPLNTSETVARAPDDGGGLRGRRRGPLSQQLAPDLTAGALSPHVWAPATTETKILVEPYAPLPPAFDPEMADLVAATASLISQNTITGFDPTADFGAVLAPSGPLHAVECGDPPAGHNLVAPARSVTSAPEILEPESHVEGASEPAASFLASAELAGAPSPGPESRPFDAADRIRRRSPSHGPTGRPRKRFRLDLSDPWGQAQASSEPDAIVSAATPAPETAVQHIFSEVTVESARALVEATDIGPPLDQPAVADPPESCELPFAASGLLEVLVADALVASETADLAPMDQVEPGQPEVVAGDDPEATVEITPPIDAPAMAEIEAGLGSGDAVVVVEAESAGPPGACGVPDIASAPSRLEDGDFAASMAPPGAVEAPRQGDDDAGETRWETESARPAGRVWIAGANEHSRRLPPIGVMRRLHGERPEATPEQVEGSLAAKPAPAASADREAASEADVRSVAEPDAPSHPINAPSRSGVGPVAEETRPVETSSPSEVVVSTTSEKQDEHAERVHIQETLPPPAPPSAKTPTPLGAIPYEPAPPPQGVEEPFLVLPQGPTPRPSLMNRMRGRPKPTQPPPQPPPVIEPAPVATVEPPTEPLSLDEMRARLLGIPVAAREPPPPVKGARSRGAASGKTASATVPANVYAALQRDSEQLDTETAKGSGPNSLVLGLVAVLAMVAAFAIGYVFTQRPRTIAPPDHYLLAMSGDGAVADRIAPSLVQAWLSGRGGAGVAVYPQSDRSGAVVPGGQVVFAHLDGRDVQVLVKSSDSKTALLDLASGTADIGMMSRHITAAEARSLARRVDLKSSRAEHQIGRITSVAGDHPGPLRLYLYAPVHPANSLATDFVHFAMSKPGQAVVRDAGGLDSEASTKPTHRPGLTSRHHSSSATAASDSGSAEAGPGSASSASAAGVSTPS